MVLYWYEYKGGVTCSLPYRAKWARKQVKQKFCNFYVYLIHPSMAGMLFKTPSGNTLATNTFFVISLFVVFYCALLCFLNVAI